MPVYTHDAFIPLQSEAIIWRYLDLEKFKSLLETKALFFCRTDKFSDPFEGSIPKREAEFRIESEKIASKKLGIEFDENQAKKNINSTQLLHKKFKRATIVNCWHINKNESDAMWRLYLKDNEGVAIQTTAFRMNELIHQVPYNVGISKIRYLDYDKEFWYHKTEYPQTSYNLYVPLIHKRVEFIHEAELRLFIDIQESIDDEEYWEKQTNRKGKFVPINLDILIEKIYLPPTADEKTSSLIKKIAKDLNYNFEFVQSKLSTEPVY